MIWPTSAAFGQALTQSHTLAYSCTLSTPGGASVPLTLSGGSVQAQGGQAIRRTASLQVQGTSTLWTQLAAPGAVIALSYGIDFGGGSRELVPLIRGELSSASRALGDGLVGVNLADFGQRLQAATYLTAQQPATTAGRIATAAAAVTGAVSTTVDTSRATDTGTVGTAQTWTDRVAMIQALLTDAGAEGYFLPDGSYRIRDLPKVTDDPAWVFKTGDGGTVKTVTRSRPLDKVYNTVIVTPAALDGSQTWTQVVAQVTDTGNPRHPNYVGVRPYTWQSPSVMTVAEAQSVAGKILAKVQGSTETLSLGAVSNPALDVGDVIRATSPTDTGTEFVQHLIDSLTLDLASGDMTLQTRSAAESFA